MPTVSVSPRRVAAGGKLVNRYIFRLRDFLSVVSHTNTHPRYLTFRFSHFTGNVIRTRSSESASGPKQRAKWLIKYVRTLMISINRPECVDIWGLYFRFPTILVTTSANACLRTAFVQNQATNAPNCATVLVKITVSLLGTVRSTSTFYVNKLVFLFRFFGIFSYDIVFYRW